MKFLYLLFLIPLIVSCGSANDGSPFTDNAGGSSSNIISAANFGVTASELNPQVLEFAAGTITNPSAKTANFSDLVSSTSPIDSEITVTAADNEGALVSTGTVFFSTQYGILSASSCELQNGRCSVTWQSVAELSQLNVLGDSSLIDIVNVITVWTNGAEGFTDLNGDRILSENETFIDTDSPYLDRNDDFIYTPTTDDTILTSAYEFFNGTYEGPNCNSSERTDCGSSSLIPISDRVYIRLNFDSTDVIGFNVVINTPADNVRVPLGDNINFTATATDPDDGAILGLNNPKTGNNIVWSSNLGPTITPNDSNNIDVNTLVAGTHTITVTATDSNNNTTTDTITVVVTSDPVVTITAPADGTNINTGDTVSFTANATDADDGTITGTDAPLTGNDVVWSSDQEGVFGASSSNLNFDTTGWTVATHVITVTVTDSDGNTGTDTITLIVN